MTNPGPGQEEALPARSGTAGPPPRRAVLALGLALTCGGLLSCIPRIKPKVPKTKPFPIALLVPTSGVISRQDDLFDISIALQPFELNGETVSTEFSLEGAELPLEAPADWQNKTFTFPVNPEEGYIDGSIYLGNVHTPADVTRIVFGTVHDEVIDARLTINLVFEHEGGPFANTEVTLNVPLKMDLD